MAKMFDEMKPALRVCAHLSDFAGGIERWKDSFYQLWRYQLTYSFAYGFDLRESRSSGVFVDLLIKPSFKEQLLETMKDFGYQNITTDDEKIGLVYAFEHDELNDIEELVLDY